MSQEIQISNQKVQEIFKGKAQAAIGDLMLENAQLQAVVEAIQLELQDARQQVAAYKARDTNQRTVPTGDSAPDSASPQDPH